MTSKVFSAGTVVDSPWLNDVNIATYTTVPALQTKTTNLPTVSVFAGTMMDDVDAVGVRGTINAAASGANIDITSLSAHPIGKMIGQIQTFQTGAVATGTGNIPHDNTIPQNTEGDQFISLSITPQNASSTLEIDVVMVLASSVANPMIAALFQDAIVNSLAATDTTFNLSGSPQVVVIKHIMTAGTTSATTFKVRAGTAVGSGATMTFNGSAGAQLMGGVSASRITIKEYLP